MLQAEDIVGTSLPSWRCFFLLYSNCMSNESGAVPAEFWSGCFRSGCFRLGCFPGQGKKQALIFSVGSHGHFLSALCTAPRLVKPEGRNRAQLSFYVPGSSDLHLEAEAVS